MLCNYNAISLLITKQTTIANLVFKTYLFGKVSRNFNIQSMGKKSVRLRAFALSSVFQEHNYTSNILVGVNP
jgi:hypothetical protein